MPETMAPSKHEGLCSIFAVSLDLFQCLKKIEQAYRSAFVCLSYLHHSVCKEIDENFNTQLYLQTRALNTRESYSVANIQCFNN